MAQTREAARIELVEMTLPDFVPESTRFTWEWARQVVVPIVLVPLVVAAGFLGVSRLADHPPFELTVEELSR